MNRSTLARRYAPLAALAALQLLIIATVPSKAPTAVSAGGVPGATAGEDFGEPLAEETIPLDGVPAEGAVDPATGQPVAGGGGGAAGGATAGARTGGGGAAGGAAAGGAQEADGPSGDTSHCVEGRQFDPKIYFYAPKCVGKFTGKNPGATYQGVSDKEVKVIVYQGKPNEAVDAVLTAQGSNPSDAQRQAFDTAVAKFVNDKFELYGRKFVLERVKGNCETVPPNYVCLRNEMRDDIVKGRKPFIVVWNTSLASPAFDELSAQATINIGGWHFRDVFNQQRRPYRWDVQMGGTQLARHAGQFWCAKLHGKKAEFAGETDPSRPQTQPGSGKNPSTNDIRGKTRVLGVISTDDPENKLNINTLKQELAKCGAKVAHEFFYSQDIGRAQEQRSAAVQRMRENSNGGESTSIMCFCDLVAPIFLYQTCEEQGYYPEHVIVGAGFMDADQAAQVYDNLLPPKGYQFENAFGISSIPGQVKHSDSFAAKVFRAGGGTGDPYTSAGADLDYYMMAATMIQAAGPNLTPPNVERAMFAQGERGIGINDPFLFGRVVKPGDYTWNEDMREVYWSPRKVAPVNGKPGTYVDINGGKRFRLGEYQPGDLAIPPKPR
jgi:hypothetical protein